MAELQEAAFVVAQGWFENDPRHSLWTSTLRSVGWPVVEIEVVDEPTGFRDLIGVDLHGERLTVRVDRSVAQVDRMIPAVTSTGRFIRSSDAVVFRGLEIVKSLGFNPRLIVSNDLHAGRATIHWWPGSTVVYDAHESFVASFDMLDTQPLAEVERTFWKDAERDVMASAAVNVTVSPGLASYHESIMGHVSHVVPNFYPRMMGRTSNQSGSGPTRFVFVGRFDPHRGIDKLVSSWDVEPTSATLDIYVPDGPGRRSLEDMAGSGPNRVRFRDAVDAALIIETVASYDVGVIPYEYPHPYSEASPNKFGEYLAAGVALMANHQGFTAGVIERFQLGEVFDWKDPDSFIKAVRRLSNRDHLVATRWNVRQAFETHLNWDDAVREVVLELSDVCPFGGSGEEIDMTKGRRYRQRFGVSVALRSFVIRTGLRITRRNANVRSLLSWVLTLVTRIRCLLDRNEIRLSSQK